MEGGGVPRTVIASVNEQSAINEFSPFVVVDGFSGTTGRQCLVVCRLWPGYPGAAATPSPPPRAPTANHRPVPPSPFPSPGDLFSILRAARPKLVVFRSVPFDQSTCAPPSSFAPKRPRRHL
ncbi:hypothetical protein LSTR_LSTR009342 [Laodelphax striatellus]|uniref:Uncharacterized protein n=1 Tax=Laodelphax striatellus TaxID=195883 RepID=A0A482XJL4_LAOST|nr:hypothetical protein LSTR_LSTR009342 [Laodelphax striatellus]